MYFSRAHIVSEARKYESKLSSWDAEVIDHTKACSHPKTPDGASLTISFCLSLSSPNMRQGLANVK